MKKIISLLLVLALLLGMTACGGGDKGGFSGGSGTAEDPYLISTAQDLQQLSKLSQEIDDTTRAYAKSHFLMTADIDLGNKGFDTMFPEYYFDGVFDGGGHTITGLKIDYSKPLTGSAHQFHGLFGRLGDGTVKNLTISQSSINVRYDSGVVGAIAGMSRNGTFENCHITETVTVQAVYSAGGLVGSANHGFIAGCSNGASVTATGELSGSAGGIADHSGAVITDCHNTGAIVAAQEAGGIASNQNGSITDCTNQGSITSHHGYVGGICGSFGDGALNPDQTDAAVTIARCTNSGDLLAPEGDAGGITARATVGSIRSCENTGNVTGNAITGGILGCYVKDPFGEEGVLTLEDCRNSGDVTASSTEVAVQAGGICGWSQGSGELLITGCENSGNISSTLYAGGLMGYHTGPALTVVDSDNTGSMSGFEACGGIIGAVSPLGDILCTVTVTGCSNSGNMYVGRAASAFGGFLLDSYAGGILGRFVFTPEQQEPVITIDGCENTGSFDGEDMHTHFFTDPVCATWANPEANKAE